MPGPDEEHLAAVVVGHGPDELVAPGLLDAAWVDRQRSRHSRFGETPSRSAAILRRSAAAKCSSARRRSFGVFTVSQTPPCRSRGAALHRELGEGRGLVVAPLRQPLDRLVVQHVEAHVDPVREPRGLPRTPSRSLSSELDDAERRRHRGDATVAAGP